jgi:uncharacterized oligopeptide transporter (OPT) family protein
LPAFLFLSASADGSVSSASYFNYLTITYAAMVGGILGTLLMIPLRSLDHQSMIICLIQKELLVHPF